MSFAFAYIFSATQLYGLRENADYPLLALKIIFLPHPRLNKNKILAKWRMRLLQRFFHTAIDRTKEQRGNLHGKYLEQAFK